MAVGAVCQCGGCEKLVKTLNIVDTVFSPQFPNAQLHWLIADANEAITMECMKDGLHIYDNPVGVMTNNPPFDKQLFRLNDYMALSPKQPSNNFSDKLDLAVTAGAWALLDCRVTCLPLHVLSVRLL